MREAALARQTALDETGAQREAILTAPTVGQLRASSSRQNGPDICSGWVTATT
ncbi:hypothetical protein [Kitasatospora purpeofusca]|uniref:hypothetical protein n=1 Tax=Kitasatospora purpeofusca TaxID=67352 RepID=UPI0036D40E0E